MEKDEIIFWGVVGFLFTAGFVVLFITEVHNQYK